MSSPCRLLPRTLPVALLVAALAACAPAPRSDVAVGTLEMVEVEAAPLQAARVHSIAVREGDSVRVGDTLARLVVPTLEANTLQAMARVAAARELVRELASGTRPAEVARAEAELRAAEADAERTATDLRRAEALLAQGEVSQARVDAIRAEARVAVSRRDAATQALRLLRDGARAERRAAAEAELRAAEAAVAAWRASATDLVLLAPVDGIVTGRNAEPGEAIVAGQSVVTIAQPGRPWARIYVSQFVLPRLRLGDTLTATLDRDSTRVAGRVTGIASRAEFTPRVALTEQEREDLLFAVRIDFDDPSGRLKAGLPVTVQLPAGAR